MYKASAFKLRITANDRESVHATHEEACAAVRAIFRECVIDAPSIEALSEVSTFVYADEASADSGDGEPIARIVPLHE
jgi:hypothetical protein